ncbi:MAG: inorganic diphosphatase [Patescibacteria group bacterium]|jgi:inorganic pyrophosphatase
MDYKKFLGREYNVTIDRPLGSAHPKYPDHIYPINYGYIEGIKAGDGDDIDVFVLGEDKPVESVQVKIIAIIHRTDDNEDKLVGAANDGDYFDEEIEKAVEFQEKYFKHELIR